MKKEIAVQRPTAAQLEAELKRLDQKARYRAALKSTASAILTTAALAVLAAVLWFPVLQIYGGSMEPTLQNGDILLCIKTSQAERGDILAFYCDNKVLVKRYLAGPGDQVDMDEDGTVYVNGQPLAEPYVSERSFGGADVEFPCQVPEDRLFVMGDHRAGSVDSRHNALGFVTRDQILGKVIFRLWPLGRLGGIH